MSSTSPATGPRGALADEVARRSPEVPAEAGARLRRGLDAPPRRAVGDGAAPGRWRRRPRGPSPCAPGRGGGAAAVRAFDPDPGRDGYATAGSVLETSTATSPSSWTRSWPSSTDRGLGVVRDVHPIIGTRRGADGALLEVLHPRAAPTRESVMHFELDRPAAAGGARGARGRRAHVLATVDRVVADVGALRARLAELEDARPGRRRPRGRLGRRGGGRVPALAGRGPRRSCSAPASTRARRPARGRPRLGPRAPGLRRGTRPSPARSRRTRCPRPPAARARGRRPARRRQDERPLAGAPPRADGRHLRAALRPRRRTVGVSRLLGLLTTRACAEPASTTPLLRASSPGSSRPRT